MKLPKLDNPDRYKGLYIFDFGDHAGVGFTAEEVAELLCGHLARAQGQGTERGDRMPGSRDRRPSTGRVEVRRPAEDFADTMVAGVESGATRSKQDSGIIEFELTGVDLPKVEDSYLGRVDAVTQLPGVEAFQEFFHEAWNLGIADGKNLSLIMVGVESTDSDTLRNVAAALGHSGGRTLDFVARTGEKEFTVLLPDTELKGAIMVAGRTKSSVQGALLKIDAERMPKTNFAVCAIQPNADGNAVSFIDVGRRVLHAAHQHGDGDLAYINELGKILLVKDQGEQVSGAA